MGWLATEHLVRRARCQMRPHDAMIHLSLKVGPCLGPLDVVPRHGSLLRKGNGNTRAARITLARRANEVLALEFRQDFAGAPIAQRLG